MEKEALEIVYVRETKKIERKRLTNFAIIKNIKREFFKEEAALTRRGASILKKERRVKSVINNNSAKKIIGLRKNCFIIYILELTKVDIAKTKITL